MMRGVNLTEPKLPKHKGEHSHWAEKTNHTRLKHFILQFYIKRWAEILANASHHNNLQDIYYVDGFAGRGAFLNGELGSPLIVEEEMSIVQQTHNEKYPYKPIQFYVYNIENNKENYNKLEELRTIQNSEVKVQNIYGSFLGESKSLLLRQSIQRNSVFWFVDPFYGARDFTFDDVIELLFDSQGNRRLHKEVLINFMTFNFVRFINYKEIERPFILRFLGASSYEEITKSVGNGIVTIEEMIVEFYKMKLRERGLYVLTQRIQCEDPKSIHADKVYFHMIHCSHNETALIEIRNSFENVKRQKDIFEKELTGDQIDFFDLGIIQKSDFKIRHQELVNFLNKQFGVLTPVSLKIIFTTIVQEISLSFDELRLMMQELRDRKIIDVVNLDRVKRTKPFNAKTSLWDKIEVTLLKDKCNNVEVYEQQSLF